MSGLSELERVVKGGYCIGCGACASVSDSPIRIELDACGRYQARLAETSPEPKPELALVCPFSGAGPDEDQLARESLGDDFERHPRIGYHGATYAGYVADAGYRERGSSGGLGSWLCAELLSQGLADAVIHVGSQPTECPDPLLFGYRISRTPDEVRQRAKSRYYPIEMSRVLAEVRRTPGRYALVGVPCFVKAVRLLGRVDPVIRERVRFCIALFCGHLKSSRYAEMLAWQCGIQPGTLRAFDFRKKAADRTANDYGVEATGSDGRSTVTRLGVASRMLGTNWGHGFLKYEACDYCDDVVGETADASIGDAWLPRYLADTQGTNVLVVRNRVIDRLVRDAVKAGRLALEPISPGEVAQSQDGGLRHRREGLAYRLWLKDQDGEWRPPKRVAARADHLSARDRQRLDLRVRMARESHVAFAEALERGSLDVFRRRMEPLVRAYSGLYARPFFVRVLGRLRREWIRWFGRPRQQRLHVL
jgi:coenzyme F420 hydrogenase subunit beta